MSGLQVFLTRPQGRNGNVPQRLQALGMSVWELPALAVRPLPLTQALPLPEHYDVVVFVSRYAAQRYLALLAEQQGTAGRWPAHTIAATVGASSARFLHQAAIPSSLIMHPPADAQDQDSEALLAILQARQVPMRRVLIVRGTQGREWLGGRLRGLGARVDFLPVYERVPAPWPDAAAQALAHALQRPDDCVFLLTSSEGVQAMAARMQQMDLIPPWSGAHFIVIHERIGATLQSVLASQCDAGTRPPALCLPDDDSIVQAIRAVAGPTAKP